MKTRWKEWVIFGVGVVVAARSAASVWRLYKAGEVVEEAKEAVRQAEEENKRLSVRLKEVQNQEWVEREIKEKLGMGRPGEVILLQPQEANTKSEILNPKQDEPNWRKWWELYIGW